MSLLALAEKTAEMRNQFSKSRETEAPGIFTSKTIVAVNHTATEFDGTIFVETGSGAFTVALPTAVGIAGRIYVICDRDGSASISNISISTNAAELVSGAASATIANDYGSIMVQSDGVNWFIISLV